MGNKIIFSLIIVLTSLLGLQGKVKADYWLVIGLVAKNYVWKLEEKLRMLYTNLSGNLIASGHASKIKIIR